jgi:hypothetical protein
MVDTMESLRYEIDSLSHKAHVAVERAAKVKKGASNGVFDVKALEKKSPAGAVMLQWALATFEYSKTFKF